MSRVVSVSCLVFALAATAFCQLPDPTREPLIGARSLSLSPDGSRLAFTYQGDIWVVPAQGGKAVPVTNHVEMDDNPIWSPDGRWIAFASNRYGNNEIFVVPADGGRTQRLTWHSGQDVPNDWSPDGKTVLFRATRDEAINGIYGVDVATGKTRQYFLDFLSMGSPKFSPSGKRILYNRIGFPWFRPRYQGSAAAQLWEYDLESKRRIEWRNNEFQHLWPHYALDGKSILAVTVSEKTPSSSYVGKPIPKNVDNPNRTPNIYAVDAPGKARRITSFQQEGPRFLTVSRDGQSAAFERDGDVYFMKLGTQPEKIEITANIDDKTTIEERLVLRDGVQDQSLSPKGDRIAFTVRGEIWLVPTKKGKGPNADDATQLTEWEGFDEQALFVDDSHIFFASDRQGGKRLYRMNVDTKVVQPVTTDVADVGALALTPDRQSVSFWKAGKQGGLYVVPITGGTPKQVLSRPRNDDGEVPQYAWSPDGRYVAYRDELRRSGYYYWEAATNIWILDTQTGAKVNVTRLSSQHGAPQWSPDGRYLVFSSNRQGTGIFALPLRIEDARETELDLKYQKPTAPVKVEIDFDDIENRARRIVTTGMVSNIRFDATNGEIFYLLDGDISRADYNGDNPRKVTNGAGIGSFDFSADGNSLEFVRNGTLNTLNLRAPQMPITNVAFRADWTRNVRKERAAAFEQFWSAYNRSFYDANFHGRDWAALKPHYYRLLGSVGHRNEMATVLNMLVGNLESSHSEVGAGAGNPNSESSAHLGFTFDYDYDGEGIRIKEVPARTPGTYAKTRLSPGEVVLKVNGKPVSANEGLFRDVLNEQTGRDLVLTVRGTDGKTREMKYRALSGGEFNSIVNANQLQWRRKYVEQKSGGKVGYVHIAGMSGGELSRFNQQVWEYGEGKKGLIIDVRGNGGGNTSDQIIDVLERLPNSIYQIRDDEPQLGPGQALAIPMVVMAAQNSFSNAEMFPYAMKQRRLATLVGETTPGYVIYTYGLPLIDGTIARMPSTGVFRLDGSPLENMGQKMDHEVPLSPEDFLQKRDPQLDKAIEVLMKQAK